MEFDSLHEYIRQTYGVTLDRGFLDKKAPALTYLKLVRVLSRSINIDTCDHTAVQLFQLGIYNEKFTDVNRARLATAFFQLADLHEIIEQLITESGVKKDDSFSVRKWEQDINS